MIFTILNTKTGEKFEIEKDQVDHKFGCDSFYDNNICKEEYDNCLADLKDEDDKQNFIEYWENKDIYEDKMEYLIDMITIIGAVREV